MADLADCPERPSYTGEPGPHVYAFFARRCVFCNALSPEQQELDAAIADLKAAVLRPVEKTMAWVEKALAKLSAWRAH